MGKDSEDFGNVDFLDISSLIDISDKPQEEKKPVEEIKVIATDGNADLYNDGSFELKTEVVEDTKENKTTPPETEDSSPSSPYLAFARYNAEGGVFDPFTDEEWAKLVEESGSEDNALFELNKRTIENEVNKQLEIYKNTLTDTDRLIFESKIKGMPLDEVGLIAHNKQKFSSLSEEDFEDEEVQEEVVRHDLKLKGNTDEDINDAIDAFKETDKLKTKAKVAAPNIVKYYINKDKELGERKRKEQEEEAKAYQQEVEKVKLYVDSMDEVIPGQKIDKKTKERLFNLMTSPAGKDENGNPTNVIMETQKKNPAAFTALLHYYYDLGLFKVNDKGEFTPDFSKVTGKIQTKVAKETKKIFETNSVFQGGTKPGIPKSDQDEEDKYSQGFKKVSKIFER